MGGAMASCQACGGAGQPCCDGNVCGDNNGCCDQDTHTCVLNGAACAGGLGTCMGGGCQGGTCGKIGQALCAGIGCTAAFAIERNAQCVPCGGSGERCCPGRGGDFCGAPFVCNGGGMCEPCGGTGQLCCPGGRCTTGTCMTDHCQ
jgi:hypothetical protein